MLLAVVWVLPAPTSVASSPINILTQHNDNARTGANLNEITFTTTNVNANQFGKLFSRTVDGALYAQPLYVSNLDFGAKGAHNVVYLATMHNTVYAFDADDSSASAPLWSASLEPSVPLPATGIGPSAGYKDIQDEIGIISTPAIDLDRNTIYVVTFTGQVGGYAHWLHALDIVTGAERPGSPVKLQAIVPGTGSGKANGQIAFQSQYENQRAALLLVNGIVYIAFASYGDSGPYHGWVLGYDAATLVQKAVYNDTPNGSRGGVWHSGQGPSADDSGNVYVLAGNGMFDANLGGPDLGDSFIKLGQTTTALTVADWFTPYNQASLSSADQDVGSTGALLIPGTNLLLGGNKAGTFYLLDRTNMGHYQPGSDSQIVQSFQATSGQLYGSPVYWNSPSGPLIYVWGVGDKLKAYSLVNGKLATTPVSQSMLPISPGMPGGILSVSANGSANGSGIVWVNMSAAGGANQSVVAGVLRAFDATDLTHELWDSQQNAVRDGSGNFAKFAAPTVANGKVYLSTFSKQLVVYGLLGANLTVTLSTTAPDPTNSTIPVTASFSQPVGDFSAADVTATNATITNFSGSGAVYHFDLSSLGPGVVTATIGAGVAHDSHGTPNMAGAPLSRVFDNLPVLVALTSPSPDPMTSATIPVTVTFSKPVLDFVAADIMMTNATIANFSGSGSVYRFDLTAQRTGLVIASVPAGIAHDAVGNANSAATPLSRQYGEGQTPAGQYRIALPLISR